MKVTQAKNMMVAVLPLEKDEEPDFAAAIQGVAEGNQESFDLLHQHFAKLVFATAYGVLHDSHDAEEVAQEVFTNVWKKAKMYNPQRGRPAVWLSTMARNRAIDRLRSKQRRAQLRDELQVESGPSSERFENEVVTEVTRHEESAAVRSALMRLKPEQREVIEMTYFKGLSQSQAASQLGAPLGTVKARIRRGITRLRTLVPEML